MIYVKYLNYIILLIVFNLENVVYAPIEKNIVSVSLRNIV